MMIPYGVWLDTGTHTFCPACGSAAIQVKQILEARPLGSHSLSGTQMKVSAIAKWVYRCPDCGTEGNAALKERRA